MQGLSVMLGMCRTSPSFSQLASVPVEGGRKVTEVRAGPRGKHKGLDF